MMLIRALVIPMLAWIEDMLGMTEQLYRDSSDDSQFKSAMRAMVTVSAMRAIVTVSIILFKAG